MTLLISFASGKLMSVVELILKLEIFVMMVVILLRLPMIDTLIYWI